MEICLNQLDEDINCLSRRKNGWGKRPWGYACLHCSSGPITLCSIVVPFVVGTDCDSESPFSSII